MKNVFKKISAIAMAFTLLGTGISITKFDNTLVANAACQYHDGSIINGRRIVNYDENRARTTGARYCKCCRQFTGWLYPNPVHNHPTPAPTR